MLSPLQVLAAVLPVYLLMFAGAVLRKAGIVRSEHDAGVMRLVFNVLMPCLILDKILGNDVVRGGSVVAWSIAMGFFFIGVGMATGYGVGRLIGLERGSGLRTFALSSGCQNFGFTAAPVIDALWGGSALAVMFLHNIGVEVAIWTLGLMLVSGATGVPWRKLLNGPLIAVAVAMMCVFTGIDRHITGPPREMMAMLGASSIPVAVFITGCTIMDLAFSEKPKLKLVIGAAVVRLVLVPAAILAAARYLPMTVELRQVLIVQAAMPAALTPILMARLYGGRPAVAVQVVIATTVISLFTLPWIITIGIRWTGLQPLLP
jgi:predicted permease